MPLSNQSAVFISGFFKVLGENLEILGKSFLIPILNHAELETIANRVLSTQQCGARRCAGWVCVKPRKPDASLGEPIYNRSFDIAVLITHMVPPEVIGKDDNNIGFWSIRLVWRA